MSSSSRPIRGNLSARCDVCNVGVSYGPPFDVDEAIRRTVEFARNHKHEEVERK